MLGLSYNGNYLLRISVEPIEENLNKDIVLVTNACNTIISRKATDK